MPSLVDNITVNRQKVWKGASYLVYGNLSSFPGAIESIINPTTHVLAVGLTPLCPTNEDGVTVGRTISVSDGIPIDQKRFALDEGEPETTTMQLTANVLDTSVETLQILWETPAPQTITGSQINQKVLPIGVPETFTERQLYVIQQDFKTELLRVLAFRIAVIQPDGDMNIQSSNATGVPATWKLRADPNLPDIQGPFGKLFEQVPEA